MDIATFAGQAISLISTYLTSIASGMANRVKDSAVDRLYTLVTERLRRTKIGSAAMDGLEERPDQPSRQHMAASALLETATEDQEFADQLARAVQATAVSQGSVDQGVIREQINVNVGGSLSMNKSIIANKVNQSRNVKIGLGGLLLAALLLGGTGTAIYQIDKNPSPQTTPQPTEKQDIPPSERKIAYPARGE